MPSTERASAQQPTKQTTVLQCFPIALFSELVEIVGLALLSCIVFIDSSVFKIRSGVTVLQ
jgi:hypothetical protein